MQCCCASHIHGRLPGLRQGTHDVTVGLLPAARFASIKAGPSCWCCCYCYSCHCCCCFISLPQSLLLLQNVRNGLVVVWDPSQWDPSTTPGSGFQILAETNHPAAPSGILVLSTPVSDALAGRGVKCSAGRSWSLLPLCAATHTQFAGLIRQPLSGMSL